LNKRTKNVDEVICESFCKTNSVREIANAFAHNFHKEVEKKKHNCKIKLLNNIRNPVVSISMFLPEATDEMITKIIKERTNIRKAPGIDGIGMQDFRAMISHDISIVTALVNDSLDDAHIPSLLKTSVTRPIFKAGGHDDLNNYRPVSILPSLDKICEYFVAGAIKNFMETFKIIDRRQFAYQKGKRAESILQDF